MDLEVPRDRLGRFEPRLVEKYAPAAGLRRHGGVDVRPRDDDAGDPGHVREFYGLDVSLELVSKVTDALHDEIHAGAGSGRRLRDRLLRRGAGEDPDEGLVKSKAVYLGIGVTCAGRKEVLGLWIEQTEGARFWFAVMDELKARGLPHVLIANVNAVHAWRA